VIVHFHKLNHIFCDKFEHSSEISGDIYTPMVFPHSTQLMNI